MYLLRLKSKNKKKKGVHKEFAKHTGKMLAFKYKRYFLKKKKFLQVNCDFKPSSIIKVGSFLYFHSNFRDFFR